MARTNKVCAVTGNEVINPTQAPRSSVHGTMITFCTSTCKDIFDRHLVKFAEKRYPANGQPSYSTILNPKYKR